MIGTFHRLGCDKRGVSAIEFALVVPLFLLVFTGVLELSRLAAEGSALQKGLRTGAMVAARLSTPYTTAAETQIQNAVRTGTLDGSGDFLMDGWGEAGSSIGIALTTQTISGVDIQIITLTAAVPHTSLVPGLSDFVGLGDYVLQSSYQQAYVGD